jgi:hypothetical protein
MGYTYDFKFSEKDIDFSPISGYYFNFSQFLINEFFNSSDNEFKIIMEYYRIQFGDPAYKYVMRNYFNAWRAGKKLMTNVQEDRIVKIMPLFLNEEAKLKLERIKQEANYKLGIQEVVEGIKRSVKYFFEKQKNAFSKQKINTMLDVQKILESEVLRVSEQKLVGYFHVLNIEEKDEILEITKHIIFNKLKVQFEQIVRDFEIINRFSAYFQNKIVNAVYKIGDFNLSINLNEIFICPVKMPDFLMEKIQASGRFKQYSDNYLANELVSLNKENNISKLNSVLSSRDLELFFNHFDSFNATDSSLDMKSTFQSNAGVLSISIQKKSIKMLKTVIAKKISSLSIYLFVFTVIVLFFIMIEEFVILIMFGIPIFITLFGMFKDEVKQIQLIKNEIKSYE